VTDAALRKKLLYKPGTPVRLVGAPAGYAERLGGGGDGEAKFVQVFVKDAADLENHITDIRHPEGGLLWVCYRKGGAKVGTDLNRDVLWRRLESEGLAGVTLVSLDEEWSAMRFRPAGEVGR
jgi:hypothetical protein